MRVIKRTLPAKPLLADSISTARGQDCDAVHIYFHDADGAVIAEAVIDGDELIGYVQDMVDHCGTIFGTTQDSIGDCAGKA